MAFPIGFAMRKALSVLRTDTYSLVSLIAASPLYLYSQLPAGALVMQTMSRTPRISGHAEAAILLTSRFHLPKLSQSCQEFMHNCMNSLGAVSLVKKPWSGRFAGNTDPQSKRSRNQSPLIIGFSSKISAARWRMRACLRRVGLITVEECQQIVHALSDIEAEIENGYVTVKTGA